MMELRCRLVLAASNIIRLKALHLSLRLTYLLTEWFIELHFAAKNSYAVTILESSYPLINDWLVSRVTDPVSPNGKIRFWISNSSKICSYLAFFQYLLTKVLINKKKHVKKLGFVFFVFVFFIWIGTGSLFSLGSDPVKTEPGSAGLAGKDDVWPLLDLRPHI